MESDREKIPWWLWPNVLSVDAPVVAVVWLGAFSRAFGFEVERPVFPILFLAVWCVYLGDRLFDVWRPDRDDVPVKRRSFARRHARKMIAFLAMLLPVTGTLAFLRLPVATLRSGAAVCALVAIYFVLFVARRTPGKTVAAGFVFAIGVVVPAMGVIGKFPDRWVPALLIFGLVSGFNCYLIDRNERRSGRLPLSKRDAAMLGLAIFVIAVMPAGFQPGGAWIYFSLGMSAVLLSVLQLMRREMSRDAFRVLADAALLTPLIWLPFFA